MYYKSIYITEYFGSNDILYLMIEVVRFIYHGVDTSVSHVASQSLIEDATLHNFFTLYVRFGMKIDKLL